jgi:hypothetical protein
MANLFDYIHWRGDLDFDLSPFNPVDNLVFSFFSYLIMDGIVPEPAQDGSVNLASFAEYTAKLNANRPASKDITVVNATSVINAVGTAHRYQTCELFGYVNHTEKLQEIQFSAYCAIIGKNPASKKLLVVFRGTDTSIAGWKEDLNMSFTNSIPSQKEAVSYLEKMSACCPYPIIVAGHSKGGNLAIYASAFCGEAVQSRIVDIYSNDAPGFHLEVVESSGYQAICAKIRAFVPQSSFVGMLFEHGVSPMVVKSTATGLFQHDISSWEVTYDNLVNAGELTPQIRFVNKVIREWMEQIDEEKREKAVDGLYKVLEATNANSLVEIVSDWRKAAGIISGIKNVDSPTKKLMGEMLGGLFKTAGKTILRQRAKNH